MIRSLAFAIVYWVFSIAYVLLATATMALPGRRATIWVVAQYARSMVWALRCCAGIRLEVRGREHLPEGPFIIAAKHHSWNDGFCMLSQFDDLAFVTGDHLEKYPLMSGVLEKVGAIVVDNCGGHEARTNLQDRARLAHEEGRRILIYPEGHLSRAGERRTYRTGVWHMSTNLDLPVVPVATNLGVFAPETDFRKTPGTAVIEFLTPLASGMSKGAFMERLERVIETRSDQLIAEARGTEVVPSILRKKAA